MTRILAVSSNKGGILKTTVTVSVASLLSKKEKVLIIDMDNQGNSALSFGYQPDNFKNTIYDVLVDEMEPKNAIINIAENLDILPSNDDNSFLDFDILSNKFRYPEPFKLLRNNIRPIEEEYDWIIIDTPPNLGLVQGMVLTYAKEVIIPFVPEVYSMRSLLKILKAMDNFKSSHNRNLRVLGVLPTMYQGGTKIHKEILEKTKTYCDVHGVRLFNTKIPKSIQYANAIAKYGKPIILTTDKGKFVNVYKDLVKEIRNG